MPNKPALALFAVVMTLVGSTARADHPLPIWEVQGERNSVYLLGSVHLLREEDYPLPDGVYDAYGDAEALYMELDMDDLDPASVQQLVAEIGMAGDGASLGSLMGAEMYSQAEARAAALNIPLQLLAAMEPWLAAITVEQLMLQRIGFNPAFGIEAHLAGRASEDGKEILGLESVEDQLGLLDSLSIEAQRLLLLQTLDEASELATMMDGLIAAWRNGDVDYLETNILEQMQGYPELYDAIVVKRNRDWTGQIEALLDDDDDYLIVVGALHLIGEDGVPAMLDAAGFPSEQLEQQ